jgi:hypothetical protein
VGAALLSQSFLNLIDADRGYEPANLRTARITPLGPGDAAARRLFYDDVRRRLRATAAVTHAGLADAVPLTPAPLMIQVFDPVRPNTRMEATIRAVSPDYFEALGMRITSGRRFSEADRWGAQQVIVINESFAARYITGDPLGVQLSVPFHDTGDLSTPKHWWRIVGVVADVKNDAASAPALPEVFGTFNQFDAEPRASLFLAVRTAGNPAALSADLRTIVSSASAPGRARSGRDDGSATRANPRARADRGRPFPGTALRLMTAIGPSTKNASGYAAGSYIVITNIWCHVHSPRN